jgi:hypothetical protein
MRTQLLSFESTAATNAPNPLMSPAANDQIARRTHSQRNARAATGGATANVLHTMTGTASGRRHSLLQSRRTRRAQALEQAAAAETAAADPEETADCAASPGSIASSQEEDMRECSSRLLLLLLLLLLPLLFIDMSDCRTPPHESPALCPTDSVNSAPDTLASAVFETSDTQSLLCFRRLRSMTAAGPSQLLSSPSATVVMRGRWGSVAAGPGLGRVVASTMASGGNWEVLISPSHTHRKPPPIPIKSVTPPPCTGTTCTWCSCDSRPSTTLSPERERSDHSASLTLVTSSTEKHTGEAHAIGSIKQCICG